MLVERAQKLRQQAEECRRAAAVPTSGGRGTSRLLLAAAERLEYQAAALEREAEALGPVQHKG